MQTIRIILALAITMTLPVTVTASSGHEPWTYRQDFEVRDNAGWSSYPPIQDAAYEAPFIYPGTVVPGEKGTVLVKVIHPEWASPQLTGAVKRLSMRLDGSSRLRFRLFVKTTLTPSWLGIDLPLADGGRVRAKFQSPKTNEWRTLDYRLADILAAAGMKPAEYIDISALAITVRFEHADPDMPIMLGIDDVELSGSRPVRFAFDEPRVATLDEWPSSIALRHFRAGETLAIRGVFPSWNPDVVDLRIARFDRPDSTVETRRMVKSVSGWSPEKPVLLAPGRYPAGMYEVVLTGKTSGGESSRSSFTFMVIDPARFTGHPRLWFTDATSFASRLKDPARLPYLEKIRAEAKTARDTKSPDLPDDLAVFPTKGWLKTFEPYRHRIATMPQAAFTNALVWTVDRDEKALDFAKRVLLSLSAWPTWTHPWMMNRGHDIYLYQWYTAYNLGLVYDIISDRLTERERATVRAAFVRNALAPSFKTYVVADQCTCNESNWIAAVVGGSLVAVSSILGEEGDTSSLEPALSGAIYKLRAHLDVSFDGDSACLEGFGYASGTMWIESAVLPMIEKSLGIDFSKSLDRSYTEMFWAADHAKKRFFTFGDARLTPPSTTAFPWLIERYRDPELAWFYDAYKPEPSFVSWHTMLYDTGGVALKKPDLDGAKLFRKTGTAVFRSDGGENPFVLTFRGGPFGNHQHLDQGTFFLADRGELLLTEMCYSDYYEDPFYQSHVIQPIGHNTILVDHDPMSQRTGDHGDYAPGMHDHARIDAFVEGGGLAFASGDLSPVYLGNARTVRRSILHIRPRTALVLDVLETREGEGSMDALFHAASIINVKVDGSTFSVKSGDVTLSGAVVYPQNSVVKVDPDPIVLANYTDEPMTPPGRITVTSHSTGGRAMTATLLSTDLRLTRSTPSEKGVMVELEGARIAINRSGGGFGDNALSTDGFLAAVVADGTVLMAGGTSLTVNGARIVSSDTPATVLKTGNRFHCSFDRPATLRIASAAKISSVAVNGKSSGDWSYDRAAGTVTIKLSAGDHAIELK